MSTILMPLSNSRINKFDQCPFQFKKEYIDKAKQPKSEPLMLGSCMHEIMEKLDLYCLEETFINQFKLFYKDFMPTIGKACEDFVLAKTGALSISNLARCAIRYPLPLSAVIDIKLMFEMADQLPDDKYESITTVTTVNEVFQKIYNACVSKHNIKGHLLVDVMYMCERSLKSTEFKRNKGEIVFIEQNFAFDSEWKMVDWMDPMVAFRGKADRLVLDFINWIIRITDYKTNRALPDKKDMEVDFQMKLYALFMKKIYKDLIKSVTVEWQFLRFDKTFPITYDNIDFIANETEEWIASKRKRIQDAITKNDFPCTENKYCGSCGFKSECTIYGGKSTTDIEKPDTFVISNPENGKEVYEFIAAVKSKIEILNKKLKNYVEQNGPIDMGNGMRLDFYRKQGRKWSAQKTHALLLSKKIDPKTIYQFTTITDSDMVKLLAKAKIELTEQEIESISRPAVKTEFATK